MGLGRIFKTVGKDDNVVRKVRQKGKKRMVKMNVSRRAGGKWNKHFFRPKPKSAIKGK